MATGLLDTKSTCVYISFYIKSGASALTNLPTAARWFQGMGCGRVLGKYSGLAPALFQDEGSMTATTPNQRYDQTTRRGIIVGAAASLLCGSAIDRDASL